MNIIRFLSALSALILPAIALPAAEAPIRLLVRVDDMGNAQATNEACIRAFREGFARSAEILVPGQWTPDAVRLVAATRGSMSACIFASPANGSGANGV